MYKLFCKLILFSLGMILVLGCDKDPGLDISTKLKNVKHGLASPLKKEFYKGTWENVLKKKHLRFLTTNNSFNYYIHQGGQRGYEYEMARAFVKFLNSKLGLRGKKKIKFSMLPVPREDLYKLLHQGMGDIIAAGVTITDNREEKLKFSLPYNYVDEVLLVHKSKAFKVDKIEQLAGATILINPHLSYYQSISQVNKQLLKKKLVPINGLSIDPSMETEQVIEMVDLGRYFYTIADSHIAKMAKHIFPNVVVKDQIKFRQNAAIAWATLPESNKLLLMINQFIPNYRKGSLFGNINLRKYFKGIKSLPNDYIESGRISPFDKLLKKYGEKYEWDWRLLAALAYQESNFRQDIINPYGAVGLFQIKEFVAKEPYVNIPNIKGMENLENNIHAGVKYLTWLRKTFFNNPEVSELNQTKLTLAAYNAGPSRVHQAMMLAKKMKLNPQRWDR
ncbi:MAG: transglycosylase SLT domain-containing protein, partial [Bacteriovoracia bacterium]